VCEWMEWPLLTDDDGSEWIGTERLGQVSIYVRLAQRPGWSDANGRA